MSTDDLVIQGKTIELGEQRELRLRFGESYLGEPATVPVFVMRGPVRGPTVFLTGGIHGDELNGMGIVRHLLFECPPELTKGTLICVPVVNTSGLENHVRYMPDRRDLNRCFPGSADGSLAARLAHVLFTEIIQQCDYGIDLHSAAVRRVNYPNVRADLSDPATRAFAEAFGWELIVSSTGPAKSLRRTAVAERIPTIILEAGEVWKIEDAVTEIGVRGCLNALKFLRMVKGKPEAPAFQVTVEKTLWVRAQQGGVFQFEVSPGQVVRKGQVLGTTFTIFGRERRQLICPEDGLVVGMTTMPAVKPGHPVCNIAVLPEEHLTQIDTYRARSGPV